MLVLGSALGLVVGISLGLLGGGGSTLRYGGFVSTSRPRLAQA